MSGFTIVELLVVIVVIALLASVTVVAFNGAQARARDSVRLADIKAIAKALELYYTDNGRYPLTASGPGCVNETGVARSNCANWTELASYLSPYINKLPSDPQNVGGSTTSPNQHTYYYWPVANNNDSSLRCAASAPYQSYYITFFPERPSEVENMVSGSCTTSFTPSGYFGYTYGRTYFSIHS